MARVVWAKLISFELQPQIHKNFNGAHIQGMYWVMLKYSHVSRAEPVCIAKQWTPSKKLNLQRLVHLLLGVSPSCHFKLTWMLLCTCIYSDFEISAVCMCEYVCSVDCYFISDATWIFKLNICAYWIWQYVLYGEKQSESITRDNYRSNSGPSCDNMSYCNTGEHVRDVIRDWFIKLHI